jgi:hypothetical protein
MITPAYSPTATERVLPRLALDFTTASLDARVTVTRANNTATAINASGVIALVNANLPRFDYDPVSLTCKGLLIEESRTNALLNSLVNGTNLSTQSVVVTAAARTLSFYGTGQIVLSGAAIATVTGTGAYPTRTTLTFTPSAGALILTVTGTVQFAQLELGSFATSFIPTDATTKTRSSDNVQMTGTNFSSWYNQNEGTFEVSVDLKAKSAADNYPLRIAGGTNAIVIGYNETATLIRPINTSTAGATVAISAAAYTAVGGYSYTTNKVRGAANATLSGTETAAGTVGVNTLAYIGSFNGGAGMLNGWVSKIMYWPQRLTNNEVQAFSK